MRAGFWDNFFCVMAWLRFLLYLKAVDSFTLLSHNANRRHQDKVALWIYNQVVVHIFNIKKKDEEMSYILMQFMIIFHLKYSTWLVIPLHTLTQSYSQHRIYMLASGGISHECQWWPEDKQHFCFSNDRYWQYIGTRLDINVGLMGNIFIITLKLHLMSSYSFRKHLQFVNNCYCKNMSIFSEHIYNDL